MSVWNCDQSVMLESCYCSVAVNGLSDIAYRPYTT